MDQPMGEGDFTAEEWRTLQFAPFWILSAVTGTYHRFDLLDYEAFARSIDVATGIAASLPGKLTHEVLSSVARDLPELTAAYDGDQRTIGDGLHCVAAALTKVPPAEAAAFRVMLVSGIGEDVARARGRYGRVISDDDAKTLGLVSALVS
jgi:hypothetical protein